jgi:hypothetical protein
MHYSGLPDLNQDLLCEVEHKQNVCSERTEGEKGGLDLVLAAEPVARGYCRNNTQHLAHRCAVVRLVKLET